MNTAITSVRIRRHHSDPWSTVSPLPPLPGSRRAGSRSAVRSLRNWSR